jgi:DNA-binding LacI/PurR family transcriptional regulator
VPVHGLQARGFDTCLLVENGHGRHADAIIARCVDQEVEGLLVSRAATVSELADRCDQLGIPSVFFNRPSRRRRSNCVTTNNYSGGRMVATS